MRKADIDIAWRMARSPDRPRLAVNSIEIGHGNEYDNILIVSRVTAFIGTNGAGKTAYFKALNSVLKNGVSGTRVNILRVVGRFRGGPFEIVPAESEAPESLESEYVDASLEVHHIKKILEEQSNIEEMLAQYEFNVPNRDHNGLYRYVCGRHYERIVFKEVELPAAQKIGDLHENIQDDQVFPFFEVVVNGLTYDSRTMGFGEFCACYLVWRMHRATKGSVLLLDEPDSHLSPASRSALLDAIAFLAHEREMWVALATHSIELLNSLEQNEIFLVSTDVVGTSVRILPVSHRRHAVRTLGLAQIRKLMIVVEDVDAKEAVWCIVNRWGSDISRVVDVQVVSGGDVAVRSFVSAFPTDSKICQVVAFLDGDKRHIGDAAANGQVFYLPSLFDPIEAARLLVRENCRAFAQHLGVGPDELAAALTRCAYVDHHDFLGRIIHELQLEGKSVSEVRTCLIKAWLFSDAFCEDAKALAENLVALIDSLA